MKLLLSIVICFMLPAMGFGQEPSLEIPREIRSMLDKRFPGWKFPEVDESVLSFLKERVSPAARPEIITGDFDGNKKPDHAVLIKHGKVHDESGKAVGDNLLAV